MGKRIILIGPACAGKSYIKNKFAERGFKLDVSYTTREPREGEQNEIDYIFISKESFKDRIWKGHFYEWVEFGGNYYGTDMMHWIEKDVFIMETEGLKKVKPEDRKKSLVIYVNSAEDVRIKRMAERGWDLEKIQKRIDTDKLNFDGFTDFDIEIKS